MLIATCVASSPVDLLLWFQMTSRSEMASL